VQETCELIQCAIYQNTNDASAQDNSRTGTGADLISLHVLNPDDGSFLKRVSELTRRVLSLRDEQQTWSIQMMMDNIDGNGGSDGNRDD